MIIYQEVDSINFVEAHEDHGGGTACGPASTAHIWS